MEVLNPARSLSRHPLFQVMLAFESAALRRAAALPGLDVRFEAVASATAKFDLSVALVERRAAGGAPAGIEGVLEYAADLFDRGTVAGLGDRLIRLLAGAVAAPERAIGALELLSLAERRQLLVEWNATARPVAPALLPALFAAQAQRTPDAVAVICAPGSAGVGAGAQRRLSYGELEARSNQLAHHLRGLGVGPETVVGLCVERSPWLLIGLLGILKAGARVSAARPVVSGAAAVVHAGGRRRRGAARRGRAAGDRCRGWRRQSRSGRARSRAAAPRRRRHGSRLARPRRGKWCGSTPTGP